MYEVYCIYLKKTGPGLDRMPYTDALGEKIYANVSKEAWQLWLKQQTMLINENKLSMANAKDREFLKAEVKKFFSLDI